MYTYWPYQNHPPYFTEYCPCCGRRWQNPYMTTATWSDNVSYGRPYMKTAEPEKDEEEKSKDVKKDD